MPEGNAFLAPNVSSCSNPAVNALLAGGGTGSNAMDAGTSNALQIANQAQQLQSNKVSIDTQTYNLAKAKMASLHDIYKSIVDNPDPDNVMWQIGQGVKAGTIDPQQGADAATRFASFGGDRQKIQQFALNGMNINQSRQEALDQAFGAPQLVNTGGQLQSVRVVQGPGAGVYGAGGAPLSVTASPADKMAAGHIVTNSAGGGKFVPGDQLYDDRGNYTGGQGRGAPTRDKFVEAADGPGVTPPAQGQGAASGAATAPAAAGAGAPAATWTPGPQTMPVVMKDQAAAAAARLKAGQGSATDRNLLRGYAVQNNTPLQDAQASAWEAQPGQAPPVRTPAAPQVPAATLAGGTGQPPEVSAPVQAPARQAPASGGARSGVDPDGLVTSFSPGQQASLAAGANGYAALSADVAAPTGVNQRLFQLRTALGALRNTQTGLGTAQRQQLVGYMASLPGGLDKWMPGVDPNSATAYDVATKYLNAYALNTPGAARSDAGLSTAQSANANTSAMMQRAAMDVTTSNIGLEVGKQALLNAFEKSGANPDPGSFNKFAAQWGQSVDPRAFALGDMTPSERSALFTGLQGQQRANFLATIRKGMAAGVLHKSDLTGGTGNGQ